MQRCDNFNRITRRKLRLGSDCSGADAAFVAAQQWANFLANIMMSEAPDAHAEVLFGLLNHAPHHYFKDVTRRGFSGRASFLENALEPHRTWIFTVPALCAKTSPMPTN